MSNVQKKQHDRMRRHNRIRAKVRGTAERPRLSVFRSAQHIVAQIIDDNAGKTLVYLSDQKISTGTKTERAQTVGKSLAAEAKSKGVVKVVFDRGGFLYAGRIRALAEAARAGGLEF